MATIKSFTSLEQSRKLAEILPLESADMYYEWPNKKVHFKDDKYNGMGFSCWSLAALLGVLKYPSITQDVGNKWSITDWTGAYPKSEHGFDDPVDACYEMIIRLNELKVL